MMKVEFHWEGTKIEDLDAKIREAIIKKLTYLTQVMYDKVIENLSGKILHKVSGQLVSSIQKETDTSGEILTGSVFPEPQSPKAWVLEKGGEKYYQIVPVKANMLRFIKEGKVIYAKQVIHPPSFGFGYLAEALVEMQSIVPEEFASAIKEIK